MENSSKTMGKLISKV